jgi:lysophospholipase L1-like esterase
LPQTQIILHGVFPRGAGPLDEARLNNIAINQSIRRFDDGERVHFMEIGQEFLEEDGSISREIMPDLLHLSTQGYERWAAALEPKLVELGL